MKRLLALIAAGLAGVATLSAATNSRPFNLSPFVKVDGTRLAGASAWSGGGLRATVAETAGSSGLQKHVTNFGVEPIQIETTLPLEAPLLTHLTALCNGQAPTATLVLGLLNASGNVAPGTQEARNAVLTEVVFQPSNGASNLPAKAVFTFVAGEMVSANPNLGSPPGSNRRGYSSFSFQLDNLNGNLVASVGEIRISRTVNNDVTDPLSRNSATVSPTRFGNIVVTLRGLDSGWTAWRDDFLIQGNNQDHQEKTGHLNFIDATGSTGFSLLLRHVGLAAMGIVPGDTAYQATALEAELYVEQIVPDIPGSSSSSNSSSPSTSPASSGTTATSPSSTSSEPPASSGTTTTPPAAGSTSTSPAGSATSTPAGTSGTVTSKESVPSSTKDPIATTDKDRKTLPIREATVLTPTDKSSNVGGERVSKTASPTVRNAEDKGIRDPAGFPRAEGTVRKTYNLTKAKGFSQESALYTSSRSMDELSEFYEKAITSDGWVEDRRWENNNGYGNTHQLIIKYTKEKDTYQITFTDTKPGEVTIEIRIDRVTA